MAKSVFALLDDLAENVAGLKAALSPLLAIATGTAPGPRAAKRRPRRGRGRARKATPAPVKRKTARPAKRRRKSVSAAVKAKRVQQGKYLGAIRPLSKTDRAKVKAVYAKSGYSAAITLAHSLRK
jgi:hypothetical protein